VFVYNDHVSESKLMNVRVNPLKLHCILAVTVELSVILCWDNAMSLTCCSKQRDFNSLDAIIKLCSCLSVDVVCPSFIFTVYACSDVWASV